MSSVRSESVKGFVTRVGTRIVKGVSFLVFWVVVSLDFREWIALFFDGSLFSLLFMWEGYYFMSLNVIG